MAGMQCFGFCLTMAVLLCTASACSSENGCDFPGDGELNYGKETITNSAQECCDLCKNRGGCWTWVWFRHDDGHNKKGECWMRSIFNKKVKKSSTVCGSMVTPEQEKSCTPDWQGCKEGQDWKCCSKKCRYSDGGWKCATCIHKGQDCTPNGLKCCGGEKCTWAGPSGTGYVCF
ncbi:hypothetical protein BSKO_00057 [Bryopsis sp. KO-2023]|nr:hypothetical protein BSKO_00057 [Bryopsis sp. KO-2023]